MRVVVAGIIFGLPFLWFLYVIWVFVLVLRFQNKLYRNFPEKATEALGIQKYFGIINKKRGFLFLWDDDIKQLIVNNLCYENQRKLAARCILIGLTVMITLAIMFITFIIIAELGNR